MELLLSKTLTVTRRTSNAAGCSGTSGHEAAQIFGGRGDLVAVPLIPGARSASLE
ncbi:hypothetical protein JJC00_35925 [Bradyrhizobium diazoefficiens]|uniref:hypothetical protein n=1 Tax=Bradyrhizobium diazoefficiens TaxID=1355477 RepID=UPI00190C0943|nr:hypothetical protein [Bradyrhizobium diazoefficiens]QQO33820.1 hypothetical protein JJC00_35925 [Bradyrhizobium diazoefficiens]